MSCGTQPNTCFAARHIIFGGLHDFRATSPSSLPLGCVCESFNLVCYAARHIVLEGLYEFGAQLQQLLLEQVLHHDFQLALQLLPLCLPHTCLKVAGLLVIACNTECVVCLLLSCLDACIVVRAQRSANPKFVTLCNDLSVLLKTTLYLV